MSKPNLTASNRRYSLDEVKRKITESLKNAGTGLSGMELADKTGINRMTIAKYLDVMNAMGLVGKKKIGTVNVWFLESGVADVEFPVGYVQVQQKLVSAVLAGNEKQARRILLSTLTSNVDPVKVLTDVIMPVSNTISELYSLGRLNRTERVFLQNLVTELMDLVKWNVQHQQVKSNAHAIVVAGSSDRIAMAKCTSIALSLLGWDSKFVGSVEAEIDPFFDIDFQRFVSREWAEKGGTLALCLFSTGEGSLRFLSSTSKALRGRLKGELYVVIQTTPDLAQVAEENGDYVAKGLVDIIDWCEKKAR